MHAKSSILIMFLKLPQFHNSTPVSTGNSHGLREAKLLPYLGLH